MINPQQALEKLRSGNQRFIANLDAQVSASRAQFYNLSASQAPFAIILGCSDSRVPAEIVFDQGLGDLFVIRVAGNIVAPSQVGSVDFAAAQFGSPLVVVLGHTHCGAIDATIAELGRPSADQSPNLRAIVDRIRPSVEPLLLTELKDQSEKLSATAVRANIQASTFMMPPMKHR